MQWESLGFKANPFGTEPITQNTLGIYTGNQAVVKNCQNIFGRKKHTVSD